MSEHKTGQSNWTPEQNELYWERRNHFVDVLKPQARIHRKRLRGSVGYANLHMRVTDEKGNEQLVPLGYRKVR